MKSITIINGLSAAVNITSPGVSLGDYSEYSVHCDFSGTTLAGTLVLQVSNDNSDWVDIPSSSQAITSAASHMWNVTGAAYDWVRVFWTASSGTGTLTAKLRIKKALS